MKAKHTFKYIQEEGGENFSPVEVTFEIPTGEVTITEMLYNFECYLKACGFVFDGHLEVVEEEKYDGPELDWQPIPEQPIQEEDSSEYKTPSYWDTHPTTVCGSDKHNITAEDPNKYFPSKWTKAERKVKEWNEGIAKLDNEQKMKNYKDTRKMSDLHYEATKEIAKNKWVHGMCNPPSPDWKKKQENNWYHNE
jgi:hypothetical protein